ncbi:MAG: hypothetical protein MJY98_11835, partial [Fibrobacter sp.]|nr:hypothetical protein [Fibrobacter sp.]
MAPTKKSTKNVHLADQESTGIEVPAELRDGIEMTAEQPAETKATKRGPRAKAPKNDDEKKVVKKTDRVKERKVAKAEQPEVTPEAAPVQSDFSASEPAITAEIVDAANVAAPAQNAETGNVEAPAEGDTAAAEGDAATAEGDQQNQRFDKRDRFNKYDKRNKFNKYDKNNRNNNNNNRQQQEEQEDAVPLPEPDSEAWCKARDCWAKYRKMTMSDLQELASQKENLDFRRYRKQSLGLLLQSLENENNIVYAEGLLEVTPQGHGFLRNTEFNYQQGPDDVYVSQNLIRRFGLKVGDTVAGLARPPRDGDKFYALRRVDKVNFDDPEKIKRRVAFEYLTPIHPNEKIRLEHDQEELTTRVMDLFSPIGKG